MKNRYFTFYNGKVLQMQDETLRDVVINGITISLMHHKVFSNIHQNFDVFSIVTQNNGNWEWEAIIYHDRVEAWKQYKAAIAGILAYL